MDGNKAQEVAKENRQLEQFTTVAIQPSADLRPTALVAEPRVFTTVTIQPNADLTAATAVAEPEAPPHDFLVPSFIVMLFCGIFSLPSLVWSIPAVISSYMV